jgi:LytS/YehU family sensor histidine kinase
VSLQEELAITEEYLSIEQVRFGPRLTVSMQVSEQVYSACVPRFLLQPLVENAIRHGISRSPHGGEVSIRAYAAEDELRIEIENDRGTASLPQTSERGGVGLENTKARLEALYGLQGSMTVSTAQDHRFRVLIQFPLTKAGLKSEGQ